MTGKSIPHPHAFGSCTSHGSGAGEEIVHSWRKRRGSVNPLVVGSNPTGPTTYRSADFRRDCASKHKVAPAPSYGFSNGAPFYDFRSTEPRFRGCFIA